MPESRGYIGVAVIIIIIIVILFYAVRPKRSSTTEKYNAGNNIDFRKTKTDKNLPASVMPVTDVPNLGSPFIIINNP
jgi:hypothetical protein